MVVSLVPFQKAGEHMSRTFDSTIVVYILLSIVQFRSRMISWLCWLRESPNPVPLPPTVSLLCNPACLTPFLPLTGDIYLLRCSFFYFAVLFKDSSFFFFPDRFFWPSSSSNTLQGSPFSPHSVKKSYIFDQWSGDGFLNDICSPRMFAVSDLGENKYTDFAFYFFYSDDFLELNTVQMIVFLNLHFPHTYTMCFPANARIHYSVTWLIR